MTPGVERLRSPVKNQEGKEPDIFVNCDDEWEGTFRERTPGDA